jgi:threonine/homoserine/homoserine lactone efflux protein
MRGRLIGAGIIAFVIYGKAIAQSIHEGWPALLGTLAGVLVVFGLSFLIISVIAGPTQKKDANKPSETPGAPDENA